MSKVLRTIQPSISSGRLNRKAVAAAVKEVSEQYAMQAAKTKVGSFKNLKVSHLSKGRSLANNFGMWNVQPSKKKATVAAKSLSSPGSVKVQRAAVGLAKAKRK